MSSSTNTSHKVCIHLESLLNSASRSQQMPTLAIELMLSTARGSRTVQTMLAQSGGQQRLNLLATIQGKCCLLLQSPHGNHVLQKVIEVMPPGLCEFVLEELVECFSFHELCLHQYGCRLVQRFLEHWPHAKMMEGLIRTIWVNMLSYAKHPFGNYVLSSCAEHSSGMIRVVLLMGFKTNLIEMANDKIASHVVSNLFTFITHAQSQLLIGGRLRGLQKSRYGSFVVQKMFENNKL